MLLREFTDKDMAEMASSVRKRLIGKFNEERFASFVRCDPEFVEELFKATWVAIRERLEREGL